MSAKGGEIVLIMAKILLLGLQLGSKWQKLSQNCHLRDPNYYLFKASAAVHFLGLFLAILDQKKGQNQSKNGLNNLLLGLKINSKFVPNGPKMTPKQPQQYSIVVVSTTVHYLGAFRSFLGEEWGETRPELLISVTDIAWFFNFE